MVTISLFINNDYSTNECMCVWCARVCGVHVCVCGVHMHVYAHDIVYVIHNLFSYHNRCTQVHPPVPPAHTMHIISISNSLDE